MAAPLHIHLDFISPYGYFASLRVEALAARHGRTVAWHPMLLGVAVLKVMGLKPLMDTPLKGDYVDRDVRRYAREHGLPMQRQPRDPVMNPLACGRALAWAADAGGAAAKRRGHSLARHRRPRHRRHSSARPSRDAGAAPLRRTAPRCPLR